MNKYIRETGDKDMELFDIVDETGEPTGVIKERTKVHAEGDLHRTSHVWIVRENEKGGLDILLQKRSRDKDSHPGCYDISSAGHIPAGCGYVESALRELEEELGLKVEAKELEERMRRRVAERNIFYGKVFIDNQVTRVYRLKRNDLQIEKLKLQEEEIEEVIWMDYTACIEAVRNNTIKHCIYLEELESLRD